MKKNWLLYLFGIANFILVITIIYMKFFMPPEDSFKNRRFSSLQKELISSYSLEKKVYMQECLENEYLSFNVCLRSMAIDLGHRPDFIKSKKEKKKIIKVGKKLNEEGKWKKRAEEILSKGTR